MRITTVPAFLLGLCAAAAAGSETTHNDAPLGLWVFAAEETPHHHSVSVEATDDGWRAAVNGDAARIELKGEVITVSGPLGQSFTGEVSGDEARIEGHWEQPDADYAYSRTVTATTLKRVASDRWRGEVVAQPRPFTVFLDIFEGEEGGATAVIRNPERNEILASRFTVEPDGKDRWTLAAGERRVSLERNGLARLTLSHPWFDEPLSLRPATSVDSRRYFPRPRQANSYRYMAPPETGDGWTVVTPDEPGYDYSMLDSLVRVLAEEDPRNARPRLVHGVLVAHRGRLLLEEYFYDHDRATRHDTRSLAKVFGPMMVGALRHEGNKIDPDDRTVAMVLREAGEPPTDPRKAEITLGQLMSFTSGLDCDVTNSASRGSEDNMWSQQDEPDFWRYTARLPMLYDPGTRYAYCSGSINLAAASITAASGEALYETFDRLIAKPLGFGTYHWNLAPNGAGYLGGGVYMRPRDILKLGAVYLSGGVWQGERIMDADWIAESTVTRMPITPASTRLSEDDFNNNYFGGEQAYVWRRDTVNSGDKSYASYEATGNGGQILLVVPDLELAVVFTGGNYRWGSIWGRWRNQLVGGYVIPAILPAP